MSYKDNEYKTYCILNAKYADKTGLLLNASFHALVGTAAGLGNQLEILTYDQGEDEIVAAEISKYPVIALKAKNSGHLQRLVTEATNAGLNVNYFTDAFWGSSAIEQLEKAKNTPIKEQEFIAVTLFGESEAINPLTRKFSLVQSCN